MDKRYAKVFKPGTYPDVTYVSRISREIGYAYEDRLSQCLAIDGYLTYIVGPSKSGKTVLCENVVGLDRMVSMSGNDFTKTPDFWAGIGKKIGISMSAEVREEHADTFQYEQKSTAVTKSYIGNKDKVIEYFKTYEKVLVLDDFHYAPPEVQYDIACQLKEVIRLGFKAIVISLPYRSDDAIRLNPDLTGRLSIIEIEPWTAVELQEIARKGFEQLEVTVENQYIERMAIESISSPQLMQSICLNIGLLPEGGALVNDILIEQGCRYACVNLPYADVVRFFKAGPPTRGQKRWTYSLADGTQKDIYGLILKVLADNPPLLEISLEELLNRIHGVAKEERITKTKVKQAFVNWMKILETQGSLYQVFDWKDETVHILDNLFLFYLRWRKDE